VETEVAAATLIALGCVRAQGFLFAKPCLTQEFESMLEMKGETKRLAP
jgi:EAL domain-containing protein (putative c-di-GMP-specific phosphodiesterase class I)